MESVVRDVTSSERKREITATTPVVMDQLRKKRWKTEGTEDSM